MNAPQQPDIEIYVRDSGVDELRDWLAARLGPLQPEPSRGAMHRFVIELDGTRIPVRITTGAVGKHWTCVWLDSPDTPWADDIACARDCFAVLGKEVRCVAGNWNEEQGDDPDAFIKVSADGERPMNWKTE